MDTRSLALRARFGGLKIFYSLLTLPTLPVSTQGKHTHTHTYITITTANIPYQKTVHALKPNVGTTYKNERMQAQEFGLGLPECGRT